jgi:hypothetical protein
MRKFWDLCFDKCGPVECSREHECSKNICDAVTVVDASQQPPVVAARCTAYHCMKAAAPASHVALTLTWLHTQGIVCHDPHI